MKIQNDIIVLSDFDFDRPNGAGYKRVLCYARSLYKSGSTVQIVSSRYNYDAGHSEILLSENIKIIKGNAKIRAKTTFDDFRFKRIFSHYRAIYQIFKRSDPNALNNIFLYNSTFATTIIAILYFKLWKHSRILIEKNELKTAISFNKEINSGSWFNSAILIILRPIIIFTAFYTDILAVFFDGIIVISQNLEQLYGSFNKNVIRVPILADDTIAEIDVLQLNCEKTFKVGYFGWIGENKDGVFSLIKSVKNVNRNGSRKVTLDLYGPGTKSTIRKLTKISNENFYIKYHGVILSDKVQSRLLSYDLLSFPRPSNLQTKYGFSTKLAEFMLSGIPVLTSSVSDTQMYVIDGNNGFTIEASRKVNVSRLSEKLACIVSLDNDKLVAVGRNGQITAKEHFSPFTYSAILNKFFTGMQ